MRTMVKGWLHHVITVSWYNHHIKYFFPFCGYINEQVSIKFWYYLRNQISGILEVSWIEILSASVNVCNSSINVKRYHGNGTHLHMATRSTIWSHKHREDLGIFSDTLLVTENYDRLQASFATQIFSWTFSRKSDTRLLRLNTVNIRMQKKLDA